MQRPRTNCEFKMESVRKGHDLTYGSFPKGFIKTIPKFTNCKKEYQTKTKQVNYELIFSQCNGIQEDISSKILIKKEL